jgi:peptide/nickel transport system substrate-binding protein
MSDSRLQSVLDRRRMLGLTAASLLAFPAVGTRLVHAQGTPVAVDPIDEMVIDLAGEPVTTDPAVAYSPLEWSIVHSVFDALVGFDGDGQIQPVAADTFEVVDETTFEARLREGMTFHDGAPVTSDAIIRGIEHLQGGESLVADLFSTVDEVERIDDLTVRIHCSSPSPWLPAQMAAWHVLLPEGADAETLSAEPIGSGPFRLLRWDRGNELILERYEDYQPVAVKGSAIATIVRYHFVPDATTRVSNLLTGDTDLVDSVPFDMLNTLSQTSAEIVPQELVGSAWIRIATDTEPFSDVRVRKALNMALDVEAFAGALIYEQSFRLASLHPGQASMGFDPALPSYPYDPDAARDLLEEAGIEGSIETTLQATPGTQQSVAEAISAQWRQVGISVDVEVVDYATFNASWSDPSAPPLRIATWSPLYDPHTLLSLVWASDGVLSRYSNDEVDRLIEEAAVEPDIDRRNRLYQELANVMHEDAAAVWLWNQVAVYGVAEHASAWSARPDEWVLPLARG